MKLDEKNHSHNLFTLITINGDKALIKSLLIVIV